MIQACSQRLLRLPFGRHPALLFNPRVEGYKNYTFGGRAGPSVSPRHIFHELGHAAEFGPDAFRFRANEYGYRFKACHTVEIFGQLYEEPRTMQATQRELETFAYQLHLMQAAGYKISEKEYFKDSAGAMVFMLDSYNVPGKNDTARKAFCVRGIEKAYNRLDPKDVLARTEAWLDRTQRRLSRLKKSVVPYYEHPRYRADGAVVV